MMEPTFGTVHVNGIDIHHATMGDPSAPLMLMLHGFPEFWYGWRKIMPAFADRYHVVAPDQRGYNKSSKPEGVKSYAVRHLVSDMVALASHLSPQRKFILAGHDWGASVAYALAIFRPDLVERLIIVNGVHPIPFQRELMKDGAQIRASQYIRKFRDADMADRLLADNCTKLLDRFTGFSTSSHLSEEDKSAYLAAWQQPGAIDAGLNWYRASPLYVPPEGETPDPDQAPTLDPEALKITMPHLVVWGMDDVALLPECTGGLDEIAADLRIVRVEGAGHWILHSRPEPVIAAMEAFLAG